MLQGTNFTSSSLLEAGVRAVFTDNNGLVTMCYKTTTGTPTTTANRFQSGCLCQNFFDGGTYENVGTIAVPVWSLMDTAGAGGITQLTDDVLAGPGNGSQVATLATTGVIAGAYTYTNLTVDAKGRITLATSGAPVFSGTPDTISPTAALDGAPVFSGTPDTISPTAALDGAPVFSGTPDTISPTAALDSAPAFTGTIPAAPLNLVVPAFTGVGTTGVGQVITTTDNQTMALNECAGMWMYPATGVTPPVLILSNTAVVGAPAVLTVQGVSFTDAGAYYIVNSFAPAGNNSTPTITVTGAAYTPAGTNTAPTITVTGAAYTPAGTNTTPSITVTGAAYTPAGTIS